jgi:hypothetical protein
MRKFLLIIEVPDSDFAEIKFDEVVSREFSGSLVTYEKLRDTKEMYKKDSFFKRLDDNYKKSRKVIKEYIHENNDKYTE